MYLPLASQNDHWFIRVKFLKLLVRRNVKRRDTSRIGRRIRSIRGGNIIGLFYAWNNMLRFVRAGLNRIAHCAGAPYGF